MVTISNSRSFTTTNSSRSLRSSVEERNWNKVREILSSQSLPTFHEVEDNSRNPSLPSCMDDEVDCLTDAIQALFFHANEIPSELFTLFFRTVDLRHVVPSLRNNYDPQNVCYSCLMHELCIDNKHEAVRILLSSLPRNVAALEAQRLDYLYIEFMSDDQAPGEEATISGFEFVHSPLQAAWEGTLFGTEGQHAIESISSIETLRSDDHTDVANLWKCTVYLLCSIEGYFPLEEDNGDNVTWPLLHAIARIGSKGHSAIMWLALKLYPHLLRLEDENGNLPIHVAAQNSLHYLSQRSQQEASDAMKTLDTDDHKDAGSTVPSVSYLAKVQAPKKITRWQQPPIIMILQKDPQSAAIPNRDGSLPLHQFIIHHDANVVKKLEQKAYHDHCMRCNSFEGYHTMGSFATVKALTDANPLALTKPDLKTGLHAFMLAASKKTITLDVVHFLLSENPFYIVSNCISSTCNETTTRCMPRRKRSLSFFEDRVERKRNSLSLIHTT